MRTGNSSEDYGTKGIFKGTIKHLTHPSRGEQSIYKCYS